MTRCAHRRQRHSGLGLRRFDLRRFGFLHFGSGGGRFDRRQHRSSALRRGARQRNVQIGFRDFSLCDFSFDRFDRRRVGLHGSGPRGDLFLDLHKLRHDRTLIARRHRRGRGRHRRPGVERGLGLKHLRRCCVHAGHAAAHDLVRRLRRCDHRSDGGARRGRHRLFGGFGHRCCCDDRRPLIRREALRLGAHVVAALVVADRAVLTAVRGAIGAREILDGVSHVDVGVEQPFGVARVSHRLRGAEPDLHQAVIALGDEARIAFALDIDDAADERLWNAVHGGVERDTRVVHLGRPRLCKRRAGRRRHQRSGHKQNAPTGHAFE